MDTCTQHCTKCHKTCTYTYPHIHPTQKGSKRDCIRCLCSNKDDSDTCIKRLFQWLLLAPWGKWIHAQMKHIHKNNTQKGTIIPREIPPRRPSPRAYPTLMATMRHKPSK
ncbi:hypothetical protein ACHAW6_000211 [Cyclotella cf. meneghiniana]